MTPVRRVARPLLAAVFVARGLDRFRHPAPTAERVAPLAEKAPDALRLPKDPELLVRGTGAAMMGAGALLALGRMPRLAAGVLVASLVPLMLVEETDPELREHHRDDILANLGLLGGVLLATVDTEGKPGVAYRAKLAGEDVRRAARTTRREARHAARHAARAAQHEVRLKAVRAQHALD